MQSGQSFLVMKLKFNTLAARALWVIALLLASALLVWYAYTQTLQPQSRTVRVGLYENLPKIYRDVNHKPAGLLIEIIV